MSASQDRMKTAAARRLLVRTALATHLAPDSAVMTAMRERLGARRNMVIGSDIDGLVSAMMLASVSDWRVVAVVVRSGTLWVHPAFANLANWQDNAALFGVDVFSPLYPSISNHPALFGPTKGAATAAIAAFDQFIAERTEHQRTVNPSVWAGIQAKDSTSLPLGFDYKYPLGSAHLVLAVLEVLGRPPRLYEPYVPWLVAHCDGGLDTIRRYHWNVDVWWSTLASVVGPRSQTDALYRLARSQRTIEFDELNLRFRSEYGPLAEALSDSWNLASSKREGISRAVELLSDLAGWPDPFQDSVASFTGWPEVQTNTGVLKVGGITKLPGPDIQSHLDSGQRAVNLNFSDFPGRGIALAWWVP